MPTRREFLGMLGAGAAALTILPAHHKPGHEGGPPDDTTVPSTSWQSVFFDGFNTLNLDVWEYDAPWFNYGDLGGQSIDSAFLEKNVSVNNGALNLEVFKEDFDMWTVRSGTTPRVAHYTGAGVATREPRWFPGQRLEFGVQTDLNFRPVAWTSAPQSGDDSEMDFEFFSVDDTCHIGQIWDYSPFQQEMLVASQSAMPDPTQLQRYACYRRPDGINLFYINDVEVFRCVNKMSQNGQRIRLQHQVGGRWDGGYKSETGSGGSLDPATHALMQVRWVEVTELA